MNNCISAKEYCSWSLCDNLYAIKMVDQSVIEDGKILIPSEIEKFFGIDDNSTCYEKSITVSYLDGEYTLCLNTNINNGDNILQLNGDFYKTLIGIWNSVNKDKNAGKIYIAFFKLGNNCYESRIGMQNKK